MKLVSFRLCMLSVAVALALGLSAQPPSENVDPGGGEGGGGSCRACAAYSQNGYMVLICTTPDSGNWGKQNCRIESYPEGTYCFVDGNDCCVD